jgi:hypothetical protein
MFITECHKYKYNGIVYVGGQVPEGAEILETMDILNAEAGYTLIRKADSEDMGSSVWLRNGDTKDNYKEIEEPKPEPEEGVDNAS